MPGTDGVDRLIPLFQERLLDEGNATNGTDVPAATTAPDGTDDFVGNEGREGMGIILLAVIVVIFLFVAWRSFKYWSARRERHLLQVQSARADTVLGDMQVCSVSVVA